VESVRGRGSGSLLVHCTAGVGQTGVYIAVDVALTMVEHDVKVYRPLCRVHTHALTLVFN